MKSRKFTLDSMAEVTFSITYVDIDASSPLNHNEPHVHEECEIYLNLSGDVVFEVENSIYPISRGSVIVTRPYEYHHCIYQSNILHRHYWITFSGEYEEEFLTIFFHRQKGKNNLIILEEDKLNQMCEILEELLEVKTNQMNRRIGFLRMMDLLLKGSYASDIGSIEGIPEDVAKVLQYMDENLTENMSIHMLSNVANVGVNTLERHFRECFHASPFAVLRKKRLIYSMRCLRDGDMVADAAAKSGFSDYSNYIQLFKKQFGMTPLQYKKRFQYHPGA